MRAIPHIVALSGIAAITKYLITIRKSVITQIAIHIMAAKASVPKELFPLFVSATIDMVNRQQ